MFSVIIVSFKFMIANAISIGTRHYWKHHAKVAKISVALKLKRIIITETT